MKTEKKNKRGYYFWLDPDLDKQIEELTLEMRERSATLKNICRMARTISAGD